MEKVVFPSTAVHHDILTKNNIIHFFDALNAFCSWEKNINDTVYRQTGLLAQKKDYDNRNQIMCYYLGDGVHDEIRVIGVMIFAASSLKVSVEAQGEIKHIIFPSIRIETFGVNESMTKKYVGIQMGDEEMSCAKFIMKHFLSYLDEESKRIGFTHVHLNAIKKKGVIGFYEDCNFSRIPAARVKMLMMEGDDKNFNFICTLQNAVNRTYLSM